MAILGRCSIWLFLEDTHLPTQLYFEERAFSFCCVDCPCLARSVPPRYSSYSKDIFYILATRHASMELFCGVFSILFRLCLVLQLALPYHQP
jgi:hypothetical protein